MGLASGVGRRRCAKSVFAGGLKRRIGFVQYAKFICACFLFSGLMGSGVYSSAETTEGGFVRFAPEQLKWVPLSDGVEFAILYGDLKKHGSYVIRLKFPPWTFDSPHYHPKDRHVTVLKGTWYTGTGKTFDLNKAVPLKAGSYEFHPAMAWHWDGAEDEEVILEITGVDPGATILARPGDSVFFSPKR
jgi:quercetin dioxygenase-like cupin family protein